VVLLDADAAHTPHPVVHFDPQPTLSQLILPGPADTCDVVLHLKGQFAQVADPFPLLVNYQLDGPIRKTVVPPGEAGQAGSITASFSLAGTMTEAVFMSGATGPCWINTASIAFEGTLSGIVHPPNPTMSQRIDATFAVATTLNQIETPTAGGQTLMVQATVNTTGRFTEICHPPEPCMVAFSVQDQIHESVCEVTPAGHPPNPCTMIDAVFTATGNMIETPPEPVNQPSGQAQLLIGAFAFQGKLQETIILPAPSPTSAPPMEVLTMTIDAHGLFDQLSVNPQPLPP
jgi:hypothetical protein